MELLYYILFCIALVVVICIVSNIYEHFEFKRMKKELGPLIEIERKKKACNLYCK